MGLQGCCCFTATGPELAPFLTGGGFSRGPPEVPWLTCYKVDLSNCLDNPPRWITPLAYGDTWQLGRELHAICWVGGGPAPCSTSSPNVCLHHHQHHQYTVLLLWWGGWAVCVNFISDTIHLRICVNMHGDAAVVHVAVNGCWGVKHVNKPYCKDGTRWEGGWGGRQQHRERSTL